MTTTECIILAIAFLTVALISILLFRQGARDEQTRDDSNEALCHKCNTTFQWVKEDAIVKYADGRYTVPCPHCGKLIKVSAKDNL
jgi:endogenous inhibitor of DNA gyrase (YacG/DUF329 family)